MWSPNELLKTEKQRDILSYITLQFFPFKKVPLEHYPLWQLLFLQPISYRLLMAVTSASMEARMISESTPAPHARVPSGLRIPT